MMIDCSRCGVIKPRSDFGMHIATKRWCKTCRSEADRFRRFKLSAERYAKILADQGGVCAICKNPEVRVSETGKPVDLSVDHDHSCCPGRESCGECIRGLLCERCNKSIGLFEERPDYLESAIQYIRSNNKDGNNSRSRFGYLGRLWNFSHQKRRLA